MRDTDMRLSGESISLNEYFADFDERFWSTDNRDCWKLERRQTFVEDGSDSYDAFVGGDWARAMELLRVRRESLKAYYERVAARGIRVLRARVVEMPITPYLVWQLNSLLQRSQLGELSRIVTAEQLTGIERGALLPELVGLGDDVVYQVLYDEDGAAEQAIRCTEPRVVRRWRQVFRTLYEEGKEMSAFFHGHVAGRCPSNAR